MDEPSDERQRMNTRDDLIQGELIGPAIVGLPRVVAALKQHIRRTVVFNDEDNVALPVQLVRAFRQGRQATNVDAACPGLRDLKLQRRLPAALAQAIAADLGIGVCSASQRTDRAHQSSAPAVVVARTENQTMAQILLGTSGRL